MWLRTKGAIFCLTSVALCLLYARFRDRLPPWWESHGGGIPYVMFWIALFFTMFPKTSWILRICVAAITATCCLEFAQLVNPEPLASFRKTKFGAALLGTTFVWNDFPPYFIGGIIGWVILHCIAKTSSETREISTPSG